MKLPLLFAWLVTTSSFIFIIDGTLAFTPNYRRIQSTKPRRCSSSLFHAEKTHQKPQQEHDNKLVETSRRRVFINKIVSIPNNILICSSCLRPSLSNANAAVDSTLTTAAATTTTTTTTTAIITTSAPARVATWPGIESLEPMYEFKLSVDALQTAVTQDPKNWPYVSKRLDKFFGGAILSEKNFYFGVGLQYMNEIKYDSAELPNYVLLDKQNRFDALDRTMKNLERLNKSLKRAQQSPVEGVVGTGDAEATDQTKAVAVANQNKKDIEDDAMDTKIALASWFALIPEKDIEAVENLFINVKKADLNRDGVLSQSELASLSIEQQNIWKKRVDKFG